MNWLSKWWKRPDSGPAPMRMTIAPYEQSKAVLSAGPPERGLLPLGYRGDDTIRQVHYDRQACCTAVTYTPDEEALNELLQEQFRPAGLEPKGVIHSHPAGCDRPSGADIRYAQRIMDALGMDTFFLPIATLEPEFVLHPYVVERSADGVTVRRTSLELLKEELVPLRQGAAEHRKRPGPAPWWQGEAFARVRGAVDVEWLARACYLQAGVGGGAHVPLHLARPGVGRFVLIDPDTVTLANLATQPFRRRDVGRPKVEVAKRSILEINPQARVTALRQPIEAFSDHDIARLCGLSDQTPPSAIVIAGMTDDFAAQAQTNRLALQLGVPLMQSQLYREGRGGEVVFAFPGLSKACARCVLAPRYRAYQDGYVSDVTSQDAPVSSTVRLHGLGVTVALMLLHHGSGHPRWDGLLNQVADRNFIQVRMDPGFDDPLFGELLPAAYAFTDEPLWLPTRPQRGCPDCGGSGDLRAAIGTLPVPRQSRREQKVTG